MTTTEPPVARYRYTLTITGNTADEIAATIHDRANGMFQQGRDTHDFEIISGTFTETLEHANPDMTPQRYRDELKAWWEVRKATKRAKADDEQTRIANGDDEPPALEAS